MDVQGLKRASRFCLYEDDVEVLIGCSQGDGLSSRLLATS